MLVRMIAPSWLIDSGAATKRVIEADLTSDEIMDLNATGYNAFYLPNGPTNYTPGVIVDGSQIDTFKWVFVDCDLKDGKYASKDAFIETLLDLAPTPTKIVDSGNGVHAYWRVHGLDAMAYLRFQRRLMRLLKTDEAVGQIFQLMRLENTINTKKQDNYVLCETVAETGSEYTAEEFDRSLPAGTIEDEAYCQQHHDKTYHLTEAVQIDDSLPPAFGKLLLQNSEAKELWAGNGGDRSKNDYRLGHIMFANGFTKDEALSVLVNSSKAMQRAPTHRANYAENIVNKIWTYEQASTTAKLGLSSSVADLLSRSNESDKGQRFACYKYIDNTEKGFRLGHVMGLVAGSGVGKTAIALNLFKGFVAFNPDYDHFFVALEQPGREIAERWKAMCGDDTRLHSKVHIIDNYDENDVYRDLSLNTIKDYILQFKKDSGRKVGCVVIDHIGVLANNNKHGQDEGVKELSKAMKSFALETDTFLIMQSQTSREKAGIGDLELNKDAAFGTSVFENYCDYLITVWQPLKRVYSLGAPTVVALKFCKIRHKKQGKDVIQEDVPYAFYFDPQTELLRELTQDELQALRYFNSQAVNRRKQDRKTEILEYVSTPQEIKNEKPKAVNSSAGNTHRH